MYIPVEATFAPDWADGGDPIAACSNSQLVSLVLDPLLIPGRSQQNATLVLTASLQLDPLQSEAVILSTAAFVLLLRSPSELAVGRRGVDAALQCAEPRKH